MASFYTLNRHGYSVKFSPFNSNCLAVSSSENFGLRGTGTLFILGIGSDGTIEEIDSRHWSEGLFDLEWSKFNSDHILTASGDGSLQLWDLNIKTVPVTVFSGHHSEVSSIDWSYKNHILSASWDTSVKVWDPSISTCIRTYPGDSGIVYEAAFSVFIPNLFASVSESGTIKLWNTLNPDPVASFRIHDSEALSCDWCKHNKNLIATCGSDSLIRGWDIRNYRQPVFQLKGSNQAIKRIRFSPHFLNILASVSLDYSTKIWDFKHDEPVEMFEHHSEFVYGLDWNHNKMGELADCSWDSTIRVFSSKISKLMNKM